MQAFLQSGNYQQNLLKLIQAFSISRLHLERVKNPGIVVLRKCVIKAIQTRLTDSSLSLHPTLFNYKGIGLELGQACQSPLSSHTKL